MASLLKRFTQKFKQSEVPSLSNRVYLITGGSNGIGLSIARTLFAHGATVHITSSSEAHARSAISYIKTGDLELAPQDYRDGFGGQDDLSGQVDTGSSSAQQNQAGSTGPGQVDWTRCDLSDLKQVAQVGQKFAQKLEKLDGCFFIAGIGVNEFKLTKDGYDSHLTINNLSHHLLLSHLFPLLEKTSRLPDTDVRIVSMSSELHRATTLGLGGASNASGVDPDDKFTTVDEFKRDVGPTRLYARSKVGVIAFTRAIVQRHVTSGSGDSRAAHEILAFATHPGAVATGQTGQYKPAWGETLGGAFEAVIRPFFSRPDQGAISALWAGTAPALRQLDGGKPVWKNGSYFTEAEEEGKESNEASDQEIVDNFYETSEKVIKEVVGADGLGPWHANGASV